jgi:D-glycero-alpha-D-manno-heptose-7-phosphate kinase
MIIARTPVRVSFLGGGTDYPEHFLVHGGQTLSAAIDHYSYVTVKRLVTLFDYSLRVSYSRMETASRVEDIEHPAVRECLRFLGFHGGLEIHYVGDLPARSGLGSSSSFTVCLLHALHALRGEAVTPYQLADEATYVERELIKERVGVQDQYASAFGGMLHLRYGADGNVDVCPIILPTRRQQELTAHLMLFYTRMQRTAHEVLEEQLERTRHGTLEQSLANMGALVDEGLAVLRSARPIVRFGELLHEGWMVKRDLSSKITSPAIDAFYERARRAGAIGGKLLGAGSGGFMLFLVEPHRQSAVEAALPELARVYFRVAPTGSQVIFPSSA